MQRAPIRVVHEELMPALVDLADFPLTTLFGADTYRDPLEEDEFQPVFSPCRTAHHSDCARPLLSEHCRQLIGPRFTVAMRRRFDVHDLKWMRRIISDRLLAWSASLTRLDLVLRPSRDRQQGAPMQGVDGGGRNASRGTGRHTRRS